MLLFYHIACHCQYCYDNTSKGVRKLKLKLIEYIDSNLPQGMSPYYLFVIMVDGQEAGRLTYRPGSIEEHYFDGHIGYHIEPEFRGHHYAFEACCLLQQEMNFHQVILTCDPHNIASLKTIQRLNARYLETRTIPSSWRRFFTPDEKEKMIFLWTI